MTICESNNADDGSNKQLSITKVNIKSIGFYRLNSEI